MVKIAVITAHFPPKIVGGAEYSASELAQGLAQRGHEINVLSTAPEKDMVGVFADPEGSFPVTRVWMPRPYQAFHFARQGALKKILWHTQDLIDPRNLGIWGSFLERTAPEVALVHVPQGLGFNGLEALGQFDIPVIYVLHDLSLACLKTSMFKNGSECASLCSVCGVTSSIKKKSISKIKNLHLVSPSLANLDHLLKFINVPYKTKRVILNPNTYPISDAERNPDGCDILYVGQVSELKGVDFLIETLASIDLPENVRLTIVGGGVDLEKLKSRHRNLGWLSFTGHVSQSEVAEHMARANLLCVPSLWRENSPGVVIQALGQGLPVFASNTGGIPELIDDGITGRLLPRGDREVWAAALENAIGNAGELKQFADRISSRPPHFDRKRSLDAYESLIQEVLA